MSHGRRMSIPFSSGARSQQTPTTASTSQKRYFALTYAASAPPGLPPAIQASAVARSGVGVTAEVRFMLDPPATARSRQALCVLRVAAQDLVEYSEHDT